MSTKPQKRHLGIRFAINAFIFVSIAVVVALAGFAVRGALVRRGLDFKSVAQGISRYYERTRGASTTNPSDAAAGNGRLRRPQDARAQGSGSMSAASAVLSFENFCAPTSGGVSVDDGARPTSPFDLVNNWSTERLAALKAKATCSWALHRNNAIRLPAIPLCGA